MIENLIDRVKKSLLDTIYNDVDENNLTPTLMRRPPNYEIIGNIIIFEMDKKGELIDKSFEAGNINVVYNTYLKKTLGMFLWRELLISSMKAFYTEGMSFEQLKSYGLKLVSIFAKSKLFESKKNIAFVIVNNRKLLYVDNYLIDLGTNKRVKLPFRVDENILEPSRLKNFVKVYPYSKIRVLYFGVSDAKKMVEADSVKSFKFNYGYLVATVDEDWKVVYLGGERNESEIEYGLVKFGELYYNLKNKYVKQMLLYVYDLLSKNAKKNIDAMVRKKSQLFEVMVEYLNDIKLTANGVYIIRYKLKKKGDKKEGILFFVEVRKSVRIEEDQGQQ